MRFQFPLKGHILCFMALSLVGLTGCHSDRVSVDPKDPDSPQYAYRLDELALLHMAADDVQEKERKKQYGQIYDEYGSDDFKKGVSRRRFLIMSNCVENYLGGLDEFDTNDLGFRRETVKGSSKQTLDVLNRKVQRIQGTIEEQMVFISNGLNFKLNGLYWIAKDKAFLQCIADSPQVEASTQPTPPEGESTTQAPQEQTAEQPKPPENEQPTPTAETPKTTEPTASTPGSAPVPPPVQDMKPSEIKKAPLQARPAGAGAVIDERPVAKKPKSQNPDTSESDTNSKPPSNNSAPAANEAPPPVPAQQEPAMPLPVPPDSDTHH
jgi:hypothetical protein